MMVEKRKIRLGVGIEVCFQNLELALDDKLAVSEVAAEVGRGQIDSLTEEKTIPG